MSFETITIVRQFPVINGFVQLPNNLEKNRTAVSFAAAVTAYPTAGVATLSAGTGPARTAGGKHGQQEWLELCEQVAACCVSPCDDAEGLKNLQTSNSTVPALDNAPPGEGEWNE